MARVALKDAVHLFQRHPLGLRQAEPHPHDTGGQEHREEDIRSPFPVLEQSRGQEGDSEIVDLRALSHVSMRVGRLSIPYTCVREETHPIARGAERCTLGAYRQREDLGHKRPAYGAPGGPERPDVYPDERHGRPAGNGVARPVMPELGHDDTRDYHGDEHDDGADDQHGLAADLVDDDHGRERGDEEYAAGDTRSQQSRGAAC